MNHKSAILTALACALCLLAAGRPALSGDGAEYLTLAVNFANFRGPAISAEHAPTLLREVGESDPRRDGTDVEGSMSDLIRLFTNSTVASPRGGQDFVHFWFYPLLATPGVWLTRAVGMSPTYAFVLLNVTLLGAALWLALPRLGGAACLLLFAGPIIWWIDKTHTEAFTFALLTIVFLYLRERPYWALISAGAASTQNPPIAAVWVLVLLAGLIDGAHRRSSGQFWLGAAAGATLAALHPLYFGVRYGTPSLLLRGTAPGLPGLAEINVTVFDPSMGLVANFPALAVVTGAACLVLLRGRPRELVSPDVIVAAATAVVIVVSVASTTNIHHGATPSLSRYALWLVPLAIPLIRRAGAAAPPTWHRGLLGIAMLSALGSVVAFHPRVMEHSREPTWAASYLWTRHPTWNNPIPEIFLETLLREERSLVPVATPGCEKILTAGQGDVGVWPIPCYPESLPEGCTVMNAFCYANLTDRGYVFAAAPGRHPGLGVLRRDAVWPREAEMNVRSLFNEWGWRTLQVNAEIARTVLRQVRHVRVTSLGGSDRFIYILQSPQPGATLYFRFPRAAHGKLVDPRTGHVVKEVSFGGESFEIWEVSLAAETDLLILALRLDSTPLSAL